MTLFMKGKPNIDQNKQLFERHYYNNNYYTYLDSISHASTGK